MSALGHKRTFSLTANDGSNIWSVSSALALYLPLKGFIGRLPTPASPNQPHDNEQQYGADGGGDDRGNNASTKMNTELRK